MRALIAGGPHDGRLLEVPETETVLRLAEPPEGLEGRPTIHRYDRHPLEPGDFARGIEARFQWNDPRA